MTGQRSGTRWRSRPGSLQRQDRPVAATQADTAGRARAGGASSTLGGLILAPGSADGTGDSETALERPRRAMPAIPGYEILDELGRGGMGVVYRARQVHLNRPCALKMILAGAHADPVAMSRFLVEA